MQEGNGGCSVDEGAPFKLPLSAENIAVGRLGRIYKALDRTTGRMLAVECIDVVDTAAGLEEGRSPVEVAQQVLTTEIERCIEIANSDKGRHIFCYDSPRRDFERLHPLAVKQYVYQVVQGLCELHEVGISCGGLSLPSLLISGGNVVKIAAWFPPAQAVSALLSQKILADPQLCRSSFGLEFTNDEMAQDVRSVAYVMLEMLTGLRVRGSLMEKSNLLSKVAAGSSEYQFLSSLLALRPLKELLAHPYFSAVNPTHNPVSEATREQRHIVGVLTTHEMNTCQSMKRQYLQQIRAWQTQFEKRYRRKTKPADRPAGIVRLQGRCQTLNERMQELNDRLAASHGSIYRMISGNEVLAVDTTSQQIPAQQQNILNPHKSTCDLSIGSPVESDSSRSDSFDRSGEKRSPAQKAFLNRFGSPQ